MSVTVSQVFTLSLALCESLDKNGQPLFDDCTELWKTRCAALCDICQNELSHYCPIHEMVEIDCSEEPVFTDGQTKHFSISERLLSVNRIAAKKALLPLFKIENGLLFVPVTFHGRISLLCTLMPPPITSLSSAFSVSDSVVRSLVPYYLAAHFLLEENPARSQLYLSLYQNGARLLQGTQAAAEDILDVYGGEHIESL